MDYDPLYSVLLGALLFWLLSMTQSGCLHIRGKRAFKGFSSFSFSLYITHYSVIDLVCRHDSVRGAHAYLLLLILWVSCNLLAYAFSVVFEKMASRFIEKMLLKALDNFA